MTRFAYIVGRHCRWCGRAYSATQPADRDGFDLKACKQAHYRAYKKYVTRKKPAAGRTSARQVTRKKSKK